MNVKKLTIGEPAPVFGMLDQVGKHHALSDYNGKWLVLYFYPKDDTPGCTQEACHFRDDWQPLQQMNIQLLGVSTDTVQSHLQFSQKFSLPFPLLSDDKGDCARSYGALFSLGPIKVAKRHSFIIDPQGKLARIYRKVNVKKHSNEIMNALIELGAFTQKN